MPISPLEQWCRTQTTKLRYTLQCCGKGRSHQPQSYAMQKRSSPNPSSWATKLLNPRRDLKDEKRKTDEVWWV